MSTFEIHPPKSAMQRIIERLSISAGSLEPRIDGSIPEYHASDFAAMCAGISDPISREIPGVVLEDAPAVNRAVQALNLWGWNRWLVDWPEKQITGALHGRMAQAVVADYQEGGKGYSMHEIRHFLRVSGTRFVSLTPHWHALTRRMSDAESEFVQHARYQLRREVA